MLVTAIHLWRRGWRSVGTGSALYGERYGQDILDQSDHPSACDDASCDLPFQDAVQRLMTKPPPLLVPGAKPGSLDSCACTMVQTAEQLRALAALLSNQLRIAIDVEHHSTHSYAGLTCLLQISTGKEDFIIDALALGSSLSILGPIFSNPAICKVLHGGGNDVTWLQRDFGVFLVNVFDTEKACQALSFQQRSLAWLLQLYCGVESDKSLQQADWRQRPLPEALLQYARTDVHYLLYIADCLGLELAKQDGQLAGSPGSAAQQGAQGQPLQQHRGEVQQALADATMELGNSSAAAEEGSIEGRGEAPPLPGSEPAACKAASGVPLFQQLLPGSKLWHAVQRSQALSLNQYRPPAPRAAAELAALAVMRRHISELREAGQLERPEMSHDESGAATGAGIAGSGSSPGGLCLNAAERQEVDVVGDCVFALCEWRDAMARSMDEGMQCVLPDPVLLQLARAPPLIPQQLRQAVQSHAAAFPQACRFPALLLDDAAAAAGLLREAAGGQRPWVNTELAALVQPGGGGVVAAARKKRQDPEAFRQRLAQRFSAKKVVYENCVMLSAGGEMLCHTDRKKLEWYISKGIAVKVSDDPLTVRLTFQHKTTDQARGSSEYYQAAKNNKCVACGEEGHYLRYRVVPSCYRRAMPVHLKSHRSHDVVLLCVTCHEVAHGAAEKLKKRLASEFGIPLNPPPSNAQQQQPSDGGGPPAEGGRSQPAAGAAPGGGKGAGTGAAQAAQAGGAPHPYHVRLAALALERHAEAMPEQRRRSQQGLIKRYLGHAPSEDPSAFTDADLIHGLLAGVAARTRRRMLRAWQAQGRQLPGDLLQDLAEYQSHTGGAAAGTLGGDGGEAAGEAGGADGAGSDDGGSGVGSGPSAHSACELANGSGGQSSTCTSSGASNSANSSGHLWHGLKVVEIILQSSGDEGLMRLCQRFRQCFVDALRPQYLPPGWQVDHAAAREFGEYSIYRKG